MVFYLALFLIAEYLYLNFPDAAEGELTRLRATLVKKEKLAEIARELSLEKQLKLGTGELKSGGWRRDSILANTLESIIGAVYLDSNINECRSIISAIYSEHLKHIDPKNIRNFIVGAYRDFSNKRPSMDFWCAVSGIEIAMWDILGKYYETPI